MTRTLTLLDVIGMHAEVMERTGDRAAPIHDEGRLGSAVMRPTMDARYEGASLVRQAAVLAVGISRAQAFLDGNKRTAYAAMDVFLRLNGRMYSGDPLELARGLEAVAEMGRISRPMSTSGWLTVPTFAPGQAVNP